MRKGSGQGQGREQRGAGDPTTTEGDLREQGETVAHDPASSVLSEQITTIWRLLRAMDVSIDAAPDACVNAFEEACASLAAPEFAARARPPEAVGGIPVDRVVDPQLAAAFRAARGYWQAVLQNPEAEVGSSSVRKQGELLMLGLLGTLDEPKRAILLLADMEQLSSPEIAALMGLRLDVVYEELRKARKAFVRARKRLEHIGATGDAEAEARELLVLARTRFSPDPDALSALCQQLRVG